MKKSGYHRSKWQAYSKKVSYHRKQIFKLLGGEHSMLSGLGKNDILSEVFFPKKRSNRFLKRELDLYKSLNKRLRREQRKITKELAPLPDENLKFDIRIKSAKNVFARRAPKMKDRTVREFWIKIRQGEGGFFDPRKNATFWRKNFSDTYGSEQFADSYDALRELGKKVETGTASDYEVNLYHQTTKLEREAKNLIPISISEAHEKLKNALRLLTKSKK